MGDRWIIVNDAISDKPSIFVMFPEEVKENAQRREKEGHITYWLQPRGPTKGKGYDQTRFRDAWDRLRPQKTRRLRRAIAEQVPQKRDVAAQATSH